jgi:hypothetical protein
LAAAVTAAILHRWRWSVGLLIGAGMAWLNFGWLRRGLDALMAVSMEQEGTQKPRIPASTWMRLVLRYALIGLCVYVIFELLKVPLASMVLGLCALGAATMGASVYEILHPSDS